jgi:hypothetical protein
MSKTQDQGIVYRRGFITLDNQLQNFKLFNRMLCSLVGISRATRMLVKPPLPLRFASLTLGLRLGIIRDV